MSAVAERTEMAAFVEAFAEGWRAPAGAAGLVENFRPLLAEDVRLIQPQIPTLVGIEEFRTGFAEPMFAVIPDLRGEIEDWASREKDVVFIQIRLHGTMGGRPVEFGSVDRITLRDGLIAERIAFSDPSPIVAAALTRPRAWPRFVRAQAGTVQMRMKRRSR